MAEYGKTGGAGATPAAGGEKEVIRALNAFRLTLFGILVGLGLTAGLGFAALLGAWQGVVAGIFALVVPALALRFLGRPIATLMQKIVPDI